MARLALPFMAMKHGVQSITLLLFGVCSWEAGCSSDPPGPESAMGGAGGAGSISSDDCQDAGRYYCDSEEVCLPLEVRCNGQLDCVGQEDEANCEEYCEELAGQPCPKNDDSEERCLPPRLVNNGVQDCWDGSDESSECFSCGDQSGCIPHRLVCDAHSDCEDGSDEESDSCGSVCKRKGGLRCGNACLDWWEVCNGVVDCPDAEDESQARCAWTESTCPASGFFYCRDDTACLPLSARCDGKSDCESGEDEEACEVACVASRGFLCGEGTCIEQGQLCNGTADCADGADESAATCQSRCLISARPVGGRGIIACADGSCESLDISCETGVVCGGIPLSSTSICGESCTSRMRFQCNFTGEGSCIPGDWRCDNVPDCPGGEDELDCGGYACSFGEFSCEDGSCQPLAAACDGVDDCTLGEDEVGCSDCSFESGGLFCDDGRCVPRQSRCNGEPECKGGEDEEGCPEFCAARGELYCDGSCAKVCDGVLDCTSGLDEIGCDRACREEPRHLLCDEDRCVSRFHRCDGIADCLDGTDEHPCENPCTLPGALQCPNGTCIAANWRCDGFDDCGDGWDEARCAQLLFSGYRCADGSFIAENQVCDGVQDCNEEGDDEPVQPEESERCIEFCTPDNGGLLCKGRCIPSGAWCDGIADCPGDAPLDENPEVCADSCAAFEDAFSCGEDRGCVPNLFVCDGNPDCRGEMPLDEGRDACQTICETRGGVLCDDGECIRPIELCDGREDCGDGSDERQELCRIGCSHKDTACRSPELCFSSREERIENCRDSCNTWCKPDAICLDDRLCDRNYDCSDLSDEAACLN